MQQVLLVVLDSVVVGCRHLGEVWGLFHAAWSHGAHLTAHDGLTVVHWGRHLAVALKFGGLTIPLHVVEVGVGSLG